MRIKYVLSLSLITLSIIANGQRIKKLDGLTINDKCPNGKAVIYGNFIQRLKFSSGGFPQEIRLINLESKEVIAFTVKKTFKTTKENIFCYIIEPGKYAILNYWWTHSKWYGGKVFTEPIFKGIDTTKKFESKLKSGQLNLNDLQQFTFSIYENSINYLGTWNFNDGLVSFSNDKLKFDPTISAKYKKINFSNAIINLPN